MQSEELVDGKYRLDAELGRGGMGVVYAARHTVSQRRVALKLLDPALQEIEEMRHRFLREAEAMGRIEHPNVVTVLDVGTSPQSYLAMELLHGRPLREHLVRVGRVPYREAVALLLPVVSGIEAAHRAGVVHRDLKPENLFVSRAEPGERAVLHILDFGVAKLDGGSCASPLGGAERQSIGTPRYMSPEQVRGDATDERTDVWGLGSLFYELIAGRPPYDLHGEACLFAAIASEPPTPIGELVPELPRALAAEIMRALSQQPADRHPSALALGAAIASAARVRFRAPRQPSSPRHPAVVSERPTPRDTLAATLPGKRPTPLVAMPIVRDPAPARRDATTASPHASRRHDPVVRQVARRRAPGHVALALLVLVLTLLVTGAALALAAQ